MKRHIRHQLFLFALLPLLFSTTTSAQSGNSINGFVFGASRQPVLDAPVELLDEYSRTIARTRTSAGGRYTFNRVPSGRFRIRVISVASYEDQEQEIEIQNISTTDNAGNVRTTGYDSAQRDFYLRPIKAAGPARKAQVIFAQEIPPAAQAKFKAAMKSLENKNDLEGQAGLRGAIEIFPDYFAALEQLGIAYVGAKHFLPAELLFLRALQINPRSYNCWYGLAYSYHSLNNTKESLDAVDKTLEIEPLSMDAVLLRGIVLKTGRRFADAEIALKKANEIAAGRSPEVHWHLATLYANDLRRYSDAVTELRSYIKVARTDKEQLDAEKLIDDLQARIDKAPK